MTRKRLSTKIANQFRAARKFCLSFRTRRWHFPDYPISIRTQEADLVYTGPRFKQCLYAATIVNWWLTGGGDSKEEALHDLENKFDKARSERMNAGESLPRPGTRVPIQFAPQKFINRHARLTEDFVQRVLGFEWAWISDESSLWDFHTEETNDALLAKIKEVYGVDVSDIESAKVSEILERIATAQGSVQIDSRT